MPTHLLVVLGAGASYDCASDQVIRTPGLKPPLAVELFHTRFSAILNRYPFAQQLAPDIRVAINSGAVALETYLRDELRDSTHDHLRRRYPAIPLYLQHLLWEVSNQYTDHPDNYDRLLTEALRLDRITIVTLNYDTLLDSRLAIDRPLTHLRDYVNWDNRWSLVKLHGSANWGQRVLNAEDVSNPLAAPVSKPRTFATAFSDLGEHLHLDEEVVFRPGDSLEDLRTDATPFGSIYYPALAAPLGSEDEIICPEYHVDVARDHQRWSPRGLNLLVIGYSGLDQQLLDLLAWGGRPVQALKVVNGNTEASIATVRILADRLGFEPRPSMAFQGGFNDFAQSDEMATFLRGLPDSG